MRSTARAHAAGIAAARRGGDSNLEALPMQLARCTPSPRRGEGWGEGVRTYRGTYSPSPHPSPQRGEGAHRVRCANVTKLAVVALAVVAFTQHARGESAEEFFKGKQMSLV